MSFNVAERIKQVLEVEAYIKQREEALEAELKDHYEFARSARGQLSQYLNQTKQKGASTEAGNIRHSPRITYRVIDKDEFRRHVIGEEAWELIKWAASSTECETFTKDHDDTPPPGTFRNAEQVLYVTPPQKPRTRAKNGGAVQEAQPEETAEPQEEVSEG